MGRVKQKRDTGGYSSNTSQCCSDMNGCYLLKHDSFFTGNYCLIHQDLRRKVKIQFTETAHLIQISIPFKYYRNRCTFTVLLIDLLRLGGRYTQKQADRHAATLPYLLQITRQHTDRLLTASTRSERNVCLSTC